MVESIFTDWKTNQQPKTIENNVGCGSILLVQLLGKSSKSESIPKFTGTVFLAYSGRDRVGERETIIMSGQSKGWNYKDFDNISRFSFIMLNIQGLFK